MQAAASSPLANYSYETVNLLKRSIRDSRAEVARYHGLRRGCESHAADACRTLGLGAACRERVTQSCRSKLEVSDGNRPTELDVYILHLSFDLIDDPARRQRLQSIPTSLQLSKQDVSELIEAAPELLHEAPEYHHLLKDLNAVVVGD